MNLKDRIRNLISSNNFNELERLFYKTSPEIFQNNLLDVTFDNKNLVPYTVICMLLIKKETARLHYFAAEILSLPLCHFEGAYASAVYHTRKAIELDPGDITLKEFLLLFNSTPDQLIAKEEAIAIAKEIITKKPDSGCAQEILEKYKKKESQ